MKCRFAVACVALFSLLVTSPAAAVAGFGDVDEDDFYALPVQWMAEQGITTGVTSACFAPADSVTRGQGVTFLWRHADSPTVRAGHSFTDVVADWMTGAVAWAADSGITVGTSSTTFGPDLPLTRAMFITMLWRYEGSPTTSGPNPFSDISADWYRDATTWAAALGITEGVGGGLFAPDRTLTRGEAAALLYRYVDPVPPALDASSPTCARGGTPDTSWIGQVEAPRGTLGPTSATAVDPESVGINWDGSKYTVPAGFTWNDADDGGYLLFDRGRVVITGNGVSISGAVFDDVDAGGSPLLSAGSGVGAFVLRHFRVDGGRGGSAVGSSTGRGDGSVISNFEILGFDGDGIKPMVSSTVTDGYIHLTQRQGSSKHYDGVQITGRSNVTLARLRFRLEGNDNINSAIFVQRNPDGGAGSNNTTITDIDVEYAPWVWFPVRLTAGSATVRDVVGRGPLSSDLKRPAALVLHNNQSGIDWSTVWTAFDGAVDKARVS